MERAERLESNSHPYLRSYASRAREQLHHLTRNHHNDERDDVDTRSSTDVVPNTWTSPSTQSSGVRSYDSFRESTRRVTRRSAFRSVSNRSTDSDATDLSERMSDMGLNLKDDMSMDVMDDVRALPPRLTRAQAQGRS